MKNIVNIDVASKIFIWANADLDGAASTILLGNIFKNFEYQSVFFGKFEDTYTLWAKKNLENYDKVFIVGMVLDQSLISKLDDPRLVIISDRGDNLTSFDSILIDEDCTSCCKLLYKRFKEKIDFPVDIKKLILYVDDYNKYELKYDESKYLNAIYRKSGYKKFISFVNRFWNGFDGFTDKEIALADTFFKEIKDEVEKLIVYKGEFKDWVVISTFSNMAVNEVSKELMDGYVTDVVIVVNPDTRFVSFRKPKDSPADIQYMSEYLCSGGGGEYASGGQICKRFLEFTEKLIKV